MESDARAAGSGLKLVGEFVAVLLHSVEVVFGILWLVLGLYLCLTSFRWPSEYYGPPGPGVFGDTETSATFFLGAQILATGVFLISLAFLLGVTVPIIRASMKSGMLATWAVRRYWLIMLAAFVAMWIFNWWAVGKWLWLYTD